MQNIKKVKYYLIYPLKENVSFKKLNNQKWNTIDKEQIDIFSYRYLKQENIIFYEFLFGNETFRFAVYEGEKEFPFPSKDILTSSWGFLEGKIEKLLGSNAIDKDNKYRYIDIYVEAKTITEEDISIGKYILLESGNLTTLSNSFIELTSDSRKVLASNTGVLQLRNYSTDNKEIYTRLTDILKALIFKIFYLKIAKKLAQDIKNNKDINIMNLREKLIATDAERFYRNIIKPSQIDRYMFWETINKALNIREERELILQQINMIGDIIKQKIQEEENRIATQRNFLLAILGIMIGITGSNFFTKDKTDSFHLLSNEIIKFTTAIMPFIVLYFLGWVFIKSEKKWYIKLFYAFMAVILIITLFKPYMVFYSDYLYDIKSKFSPFIQFFLKFFEFVKSNIF